MPANIIIFESEYIAELVSNLNSACEMMSEAVNDLKQASYHEGWKCKECVRIASELDELNQRLGRLDTGMNETARILGGSVSRFTSLEASYRTQSNLLSEELTEQHGYRGTVHSDTSNLIEARTDIDSNSSNALSSATASGGGAGVIISGNMKSGTGTRTGTESRTGTIIESGARTATRAVTESRTESGIESGTGAMNSSVSVNLPVTHIPDRPEAAAKGIRETREIADIAVTSVASRITETLNQNPIKLQTSTGAGMVAQSLVETYNAGKTIVENSATIMSNPTMPHTRERLAMAEGIVNLAGNSVFGSSGSAASGSSMSNSSGNITSGSIMSENVRNNAGSLITAMKDVNNGGELSSVLSSFMSGNNSGSSDTFLDKIIEALKKSIAGNNEKVSSGKTSPVEEFLNNLIME